MRKLLISIGLFLTLSLSGQQIPFGTISSQGVVAAAPSNMISNGTFDDGTGWSIGDSWSISGGVATYDDLTDDPLGLLQYDADMVSPILANTSYILTFTVTGTTGAGMYIRFVNINEGSDVHVTYVNFADYNDGDKTVTFTTPADIGDGGFRIHGNTAGESGGSIDNIVLKVTE